MAVRIVTDSSSDLPFSLQEEWGITILPLRVLFGEEEFVDGELTAGQFYERLAQAKELPKTAQVTPAEFEDVLRPCVEAGDEVLLLPLSRELSGTFASARIAREQFPDAEIYVVDTLQVTFALGLMVETAVRLRDEGLSAREIAERLEELRGRIRLYAVIDDLKYLRMGGRLSAAGAVMGSLLGIKPIVTLREGKVCSIDKARGMKAGCQMLLDRTAEDGVDEAYPVYFGNSNVREAMEELRQTAKAGLSVTEAAACDIGPIVGTHAGPGCVGLAFVARAADDGKQTQK